MADADEEKKDDQQEQEPQAEDSKPEDSNAEDSNAEDSNADDAKAKTSKGGILPWIILAVVVIICAAAGFGLSSLLAKPSTEQETPKELAKQAEQIKTEEPANEPEGTWFYDLDPAVANLDEPGVTRYVRVALTLEISNALEQREGTLLLETKKPVLTNWLTIYLASLTLEDVRGNKNLRRIQTQLLDAFNEKLFPDSKPKIKHLLFKEFAIQ